MKKILILVLLFFMFNLFSLFSKESFQSIVRKNDMVYTNPSNDFNFSPVKINKDVKYEFGLKHKSKKLEIRYSIFPIGEMERMLKKNDVTDDVQDEKAGYMRYSMFTYTILMNIAQKEENFLNAANFKEPDVKSEFNADYGSSILVTPKSEFGRGYKFVMIIALYKKGKSYAYTYFLFDDFNAVNADIAKMFYCLRYK